MTPSALEIVFRTLRTRGCVSDATPGIAAGVAAALSTKRSLPASVYAGFDPTGPSLHLGHAVILVGLARLQRLGLRPIALIGGATALVGDPTGKRDDRPMLSEEVVARNVEGIRRCIGAVLDLEGEGQSSASSSSASSSRPRALLVNNASFYSGMSFLEFLRVVGRHARVSAMLAKDSVKSRLGAGAEEGAEGGAEGGSPEGGGISFAEFSYQLLQAYDFAVLHRRYGCVLQLGGNDQWGNMTAGIDLIRRMGTGGQEGVPLLAPPHALTVPLLTTADGKKFGKTEGAPVWLDPSLTSDHAFFQYLLRSSDADVRRLLTLLTLLEEGEVEGAMRAHAEKPEKKTAQLLLADSVTALLRGEAAVRSARRTASLLYAGTEMWGGAAAGTLAAATSGGDAGSCLPQRALLAELRPEDVLALGSSGEVPLLRLPRARLEGAGQGATVVDVAVAVGAAKSKAEARRLIEGGGVYWNWERVSAKEGAWAAPAASPATAARPGGGGGGGGGGPLALRPVVPSRDLVGGRVAVLSVGKKRMFVVEVVEEEEGK
jgi:tyrosyl-tRNA synthetase